MNITKVQAFMDALNLDVAIERVGENETLPERWREGAEHFRAMLSRPGAREFHYLFSISGFIRPIDGPQMLYLIAGETDRYEKHPTVESWCAAAGVPVEDVAEQFHTFEAERRDLMRFFGDHYADFLELTHD